MPEGDTIHQLAERLGPLLIGQRLVSCLLSDRFLSRRLTGQSVRAVRAVGKHLLIDTTEGLTLRTHLGMHGRWQVHAPGERWRGPAQRASLVLVTAAHELVLFDAAQIGVHRSDALSEAPALARLGPDLIEPGALDVGALCARFAAHAGERVVAEVLLDQGVAAGIGNVYKCEVLFLARLSPFTPAPIVPEAAVVELYLEAQRLLRHNARRSRRETTIDARGRRLVASDHWVYERAGLPCFACGHPIEVKRHGREPRPTWWCGRCQPL